MQTATEDSAAKPTNAPGRRRDPSAVVGIGASAGGLETFVQLLGSLPSDTGMGFVLIQHLDPTHASFLTAALAKATSMHVEEIRDGATVEPNCVYVIPPNTDIGIHRGKLSVQPRDQAQNPHMSIDFFFRALALDRGNRAIGVVLSGTGRDGTVGLGSIKAAGGITLAQTPATAKFSGMPLSAVAAGAADLCLDIEQLAGEIVRLARHPYFLSSDAEPFTSEDDRADIDGLLALVHRATGVDYKHYKETTIRRRLERRMALHKLEHVRDYMHILQRDPGEAQSLCEDMLIHVTSFFRDPEMFEVLKARVFPQLIRDRPRNRPIRMWVPGCATGEEAYSLVIALLEVLGDQYDSINFQVFGSDISEHAIERARAGVYSDAALRDIGPERARRFFTLVEGGHRVAKRVRERCIFVRHDVSQDPPFSKVDLVSCRNVLIYFDQMLQSRTLALLHYALTPAGFLVLGRTESVSSDPALFEPMDKANRIYTRAAIASTIHVPLTRDAQIVAAHPHTRGSQVTANALTPPPDAGKQVDSLLLAEYAPCGVVVNERLEILQFRGLTGAFLEAAPGRPQLSLLKMAREGLLGPLRTALRDVKKTMSTVRRDGLRVQDGNGHTRRCDLVVFPVTGSPEAKEVLFVVLFEEVQRKRAAHDAKDKTSPNTQRKLAPRDEADATRELAATREYLQSLTEEHQKTTETLSLVNEELMSANEELQSMNEELETAKEELQSTNEELSTVNDELQQGNRALSQTNNDLLNLLSSVEIPIVFLDLDRRIRRFTPPSRSLLNLLPSDVGRQLQEIRPKVPLEGLDERIIEVVETATMSESEVQERGGRWHRMQIRPYKTLDDRIDGVVLSFVDIDPLKRAVADAEWARDYASALVEAVQVPLVAIDRAGAVRSANTAFYDLFGGSRATTESHNLFSLDGGVWDIPAIREALSDTVASRTKFQNVLVARDFPGLGRRTLSLSAQAVGIGIPWILLALEDITQRERGERERARLLEEARRAKDEAELANGSKDVFLATLSHELRTPLNSLVLQAQVLGRGESDPQKIKLAAERIQRAVNMQVQLIDDLFDASRIMTGKLSMELRTVDVADVMRAAVEMVQVSADKKGVALECLLEGSIGRVSGDPERLQQVFTNLLTNAIKFTGRGGQVSVRSVPDGDANRVRVQVRDTGIGFEQQLAEQLFGRFAQANPAVTRNHGGLGLGLAIVRHLVEAHGGHVEAQSPGRNMGATFTVALPLLKPVTLPPALESAPQPADSLQRTRGPGNLAGLRILLVDDDEDARSTLVEMLEGTHVTVRVAGSAEEAFRAVGEFKPHLLVSDIAMPDEDGYSLIRRIRALGPNDGGALPALAVTALPGAEYERRALDAGFQLQLSKPVDFLRLQAALLKLFRVYQDARVSAPLG